VTSQPFRQSKLDGLRKAVKEAEERWRGLKGAQRLKGEEKAKGETAEMNDFQP
jgi:hypothetical protein